MMYLRGSFQPQRLLFNTLQWVWKEPLRLKGPFFAQRLLKLDCREWKIKKLSLLDQLTLGLGTKWVPSSALSVENLSKRNHFCTFTKIEHMTRQCEAMHSQIRLFEESHRYLNNQKGSISHVKMQQKSTVHINIAYCLFQTEFEQLNPNSHGIHSPHPNYATVSVWHLLCKFSCHIFKTPKQGSAWR